MKTLIAIDIGNTSIHLASHSGRKWATHRRVPTQNYRRGVVPVLKRLLKKNKGSAVVIASVVPEAGKFLKREISNKLGLSAHLIGPGYEVPMVNRYKNPRKVGVDRLLGALAAFRRLKKPLIVVDFGTAITFDIVSIKGEYLGGVIAPGIEISLEALFQKTALLPKIHLKHPAHIIAKDTVESIRVGCSVGIGGLCDRVIEEIEKQNHFKAKILATGGYAAFMKRYCHRIGAIDADLVVDGIRLTYLDHLPK